MYEIELTYCVWLARLGTGVTFQGVLNTTREELARHYLRTTSMSGAEISFLLGFADPTSFARAFREWTGTTPEQARREAVGRSASSPA